jgi:hypothetical protein
MKSHHIPQCTCAECIARFGLGPRPPIPAPKPPTAAELELQRAIDATPPRVQLEPLAPAPLPSDDELERLTAPPASSSSAAKGFVLELNDPDLERLQREARDRELAELGDDQADDEGDDDKG